jgi:hypothetical protein
MNINLTIDDSQLQRLMAMRVKKLPYATERAINKTASAIQVAEQQNVLSHFIIRQPEFMRRQAAYRDRTRGFASVKRGQLWAEVSVGQKPRLLLSEFEKGGPRKPFTPGAKHVAVPITGRPARPSIAQGVPPAFTFKGLRLVRTHGGAPVRTKSGKLRRRRATIKFGVNSRGQIKGQQGTFILSATAKAPEGGVFQRIGKGQIRMIYSFQPPFKLDARLSFVATAQTVAQQWFHEYMEREVIEALAHEAGRSA